MTPSHAVRLQHKMPFKVHPHHAKPVRKRHVVGLSLFLLISGLSVIAGVRFMYDQYDKQMSATISAQNNLDIQPVTSKITALRSTLGFNISFDPQSVSVTATEVSENGNTQNYDGSNVGLPRAYAAILLTPAVRGTNSGSNNFDRSSMTVLAPQENLIDGSEPGLRQLATRYAEASNNEFDVALADEVRKSIGGVEFLKQTYLQVPKYKSRGNLNFGPTTAQLYVGRLPNGRPIIIKLNSISQTASTQSVYDQVLGTFSASAVAATADRASAEFLEANVPKPKFLNLAERLGLHAKATAASVSQMDNSRVVAINAPAVVKLYHIVCGSVVYRNQTLLDDGCEGGTGTGFFISSDGYIATNGHVVSATAKDTIASSLDATTFGRMLEIEGYSRQEIASLTSDIGSDQAAQATVLQAIVQLKDDVIRYENQTDFYIVALGTEVPNFDQLLKNRNFIESPTIKKATLKAIDYNFNDLYSAKGFTRSDVALLKIDGKNYPTTRLGTLDNIVQGASVTVIGFPGEAEMTNLIKNDRLQATATQGIVSAIRESTGNSRKVVQSDVNIGHGNSGGPAFDSSGAVFGIATYLLSGSNNGDTDISYLRDIEDIKDLVRSQSIVLNSMSASQTAWESGLEDFYNARYTSAIKKFHTAEALYSPNMLTGQYISLAQTKIANGEEAQDSRVLFVIIGFLAASLLGTTAVIIIMVRHRAHHHMFQAATAGLISGSLVKQRHQH